MLPSMTAAVLFAWRGRGFLAGVAIALATLAKQTGAATLLPVVYLIARSRGKKGIGEVALGFTIPTALVALAMGPAQLLYWTVLGNGSYVGMKTMSTVVLTTFLFMTGMWALCNLPLLWKVPSAWGHRALRALDGERDTDLWLWLLSAAVSVAVGLRFFGHYYMQLAPPLALLAAGALVRGSRKWADRTVAFAARGRPHVLGGGLLLPPGCPGTELRVGVALPRHHDQSRRPDLRVGQRAGDLLGVGPAPGDAFPDVVVPHRQLSGTPAAGRQHRERHPGRVARLLHRLHRAPAEVLRRHVTGQGARARSTTRSPTSPGCRRSSRASTATSSPSTTSPSTSASRPAPSRSGVSGALDSDARSTPQRGGYTRGQGVLW